MPGLPRQVADKKKWRVSAYCAGWAFGLLILFVFNPETTHIFPPCPVLWLTGFYCPGCGALRAMHYLLHGHLVQATLLNPLVGIVVPPSGMELHALDSMGCGGPPARLWYRPKYPLPAIYAPGSSI